MLYPVVTVKSLVHKAWRKHDLGKFCSNFTELRLIKKCHNTLNYQFVINVKRDMSISSNQQRNSTDENDFVPPRHGGGGGIVRRGALRQKVSYTSSIII